VIAENSTSASASATPFINPRLVVEREDGLFQIGWHDDAAGPFESRAFAESVARPTPAGVSS
jgi:hypothetical protein